LGFFERAIVFEKASDNVDRVRELYDRTLERFGKSAEHLWIEYMQFETEQRRFKTAARIYWKAKKTLANPTRFVQRCVALTNSTEAAEMK
jgi:hypothetical protein